MTGRPPHFLLIADVGGERARHIGDEAMLETNLDSLRALFPGATFTVVAADPAWVATRYGVQAVPLFGFKRDDAAAERDALLASLLESTEHPTIAAVAESDAVFVSGGGNLSSTWPDLLYERVALLELARRFQKPAIVLGQTLGPSLDADERRLLGAALSYARLVGVREIPSAFLALELGLAERQLWYQADDALFPAGAMRAPQKTATIAVTIDPQVRGASEKLFDALAAQLRALAEQTGATLLLIGHAFGDETPGVLSDRTEARLLAQRIGESHVSIAGELDADATRDQTAAAQLIISSRYHPIVFGLAAGVPCIGIYGDDYCRIKLQGALAHAEREQWTLTYEQVARGALLGKALDLWQTRDDARAQLDARVEAWRCEQRERWAAVRAALQGEWPGDAQTLFGRPPAALAAPLAAAFAAQRQWAEERLHAAMRPRGLRRIAAGLRRRMFRK